MLEIDKSIPDKLTEITKREDEFRLAESALFSMVFRESAPLNNSFVTPEGLVHVTVGDIEGKEEMTLTQYHRPLFRKALGNRVLISGDAITPPVAITSISDAEWDRTESRYEAAGERIRIEKLGHLSYKSSK